TLSGNARAVFRCLALSRDADQFYYAFHRLVQSAFVQAGTRCPCRSHEWLFASRRDRFGAFAKSPMRVGRSSAASYSSPLLTQNHMPREKTHEWKAISTSDSAYSGALG